MLSSGSEPPFYRLIMVKASANWSAPDSMFIDSDSKSKRVPNESVVSVQFFSRFAANWTAFGSAAAVSERADPHAASP
jgi:hypothetical protein